jgi:hypothetical protein
MARIFAFISYGQGGAVVDSVLAGDGIGRLVQRIRSLGVDAAPRPFGWDQYESTAAAIKQLPPEHKIIIGGASLGANMAPWIAAAVYPRPVDLIFGIQPSLYGGKYPISKNVRNALCIYNPVWLMTLGLGAYQWQRDTINHSTVLTTRSSYALHPGDNVNAVQDAILAEVRAVKSAT